LGAGMPMVAVVFIVGRAVGTDRRQGSAVGRGSLRAGVAVRAVPVGSWREAEIGAAIVFLKVGATALPGVTRPADVAVRGASCSRTPARRCSPTDKINVDIRKTLDNSTSAAG
jgi:hypothetical protein